MSDLKEEDIVLCPISRVISAIELIRKRDYRLCSGEAACELICKELESEAMLDSKEVKSELTRLQAEVAELKANRDNEWAAALRWVAENVHWVDNAKLDEVADSIERGEVNVEGKE